VCQLRAAEWEQVKELRHKLQTVQKAHAQQVETLQVNCVTIETIPMLTKGVVWCEG